MSIEYAFGYHEAWEVWLHAWRAKQREGGGTVDPKIEVKELEYWITKNRQRASVAELCPYCQEEIAAAILAGHDPFKMPQYVKDAIEVFEKMRWRAKRSK